MAASQGEDVMRTMKKTIIALLAGLGILLGIFGRSVSYAQDVDENLQNQTESPGLEQHEPLSNPVSSSRIDVLDLKNMDILDVLKLISQKTGLNIVGAQNVQGRVSIYLKDIDVFDALRIIVEAYQWAYVQDNDIVKILTAADYERKYGHKFGYELKTVIRQLFYTDAMTLVNILNQIKSEAGKVISEDKSRTLILIDEPEKIDKMQQLIDQIDVPMKTEVFDVSYTDMKDVVEKIEAVLTPSFGTIKSNERAKKIIVSDTEQQLGKVRQIIEAFNEKDKQVLIEAKILQIVLSDEYKLGVDWEGIVNNYHKLDLKGDFDILTSSDKSGRLSVGTLASDEYTAAIEALNTIGKTNILSSPRIAVINDKEAKILVGSTRPYVTSTVTTPASGPTVTAESVNFIEVGVKLFVTPTIHEDGFITMKIRPEVSSITSTITTSTNNTIPVVDTSEAETTVVVQDGTTIVIGGLIKEENIKTVKKVPLFGDLPFLGAAFRNENHSVTKTEIVIFLTPQIVSGDAKENVAFDKFAPSVK